MFITLELHFICLINSISYAEEQYSITKAKA